MSNHTNDIPLIRYFNIYVNLFYLLFGNLGNLCKILFFLQKPLRSLPCSTYILFSTFSDFITLNNLPILHLFSHLFPNYHWIRSTVDWSNHPNHTTVLFYHASTYDIIICKVRSYFHLFSTDLSFEMLLFASINRFCSTHRRKKRRTNTFCFIRYFCDHPNVYKLCLISSLLTALISLQHVVNFTVNSPSEGCVPQNRILWVVWISTIHCFLLPILMILFAVLTLRTIRYSTVFGDFCHCLQARRRRAHHFLARCLNCSHCNNSIQYQIDRQLTAMIIAEVLVTIVTLLPNGIYAFSNLLCAIQRRTLVDPSQSLWIPLFIRTTIYFEPSCGFYMYLMTLTTLRERFYKMLMEGLLSVYHTCWRKQRIVVFI